MRSFSTVARILQAVALAPLAGAAVWSGRSWSLSLWIAAAGFALIVVSCAGGLALEFFMLRKVNQVDPVPQAGWTTLVRAWAVATLQALRVFGWRQPFRWNAVPDRLAPELHGRRGVVFLHGFFCNRGFWTPWLQRLTATGHPFAAVNLEPAFGSIDDYVPIVERAVAAVARAGGLPPLVVCHSMGGLAARAWLRAAANTARVYHVVTIGTPHRGTWLGRFSRMENGRQMALDSSWLQALAEDSVRRPQPGFTCWYSNCDNIVFPSSTATLPGADNRLMVGVAHVDLAFHPLVVSDTLAMLGRQCE